MRLSRHARLRCRLPSMRRCPSDHAQSFLSSTLVRNLGLHPFPRVAVLDPPNSIARAVRDQQGGFRSEWTASIVDPPGGHHSAVDPLEVSYASVIPPPHIICRNIVAAHQDSRTNSRDRNVRVGNPYVNE